MLRECVDTVDMKNNINYFRNQNPLSIKTNIQTYKIAVGNSNASTAEIYIMC
jgi:hypothetical protein